MLAAALIGALAQSSLILSGLAVYVVRVPWRIVGGAIAGIATVVGFAVSLATT